MGNNIPLAIQWLVEYLLAGTIIVEGSTTIFGELMPGVQSPIYVVNEQALGIGDSIRIFNNKGEDFAFIPAGYLTPLELAHWVGESISNYRWCIT